VVPTNACAVPLARMAKNAAAPARQKPTANPGKRCMTPPRASTAAPRRTGQTPSNAPVSRQGVPTSDATPRATSPPCEPAWHKKQIVRKKLNAEKTRPFRVSANLDQRRQQTAERKQRKHPCHQGMCRTGEQPPRALSRSICDKRPSSGSWNQSSSAAQTAPTPNARDTPYCHQQRQLWEHGCKSAAPPPPAVTQTSA